jgi:hypothetical protein
MVGALLGQVQTQSIALVIFFTFCQVVIGTMCALPDLSGVEETAILGKEPMACPMDGTIMCPPSVTSSPERQVKNGGVTELDHGAIILSPGAMLPACSVQTLWSGNSPYSIVPISMASSSVLRL